MYEETHNQHLRRTPQTIQDCLCLRGKRNERSSPQVYREIRRGGREKTEKIIRRKRARKLIGLQPDPNPAHGGNHEQD